MTSAGDIRNARGRIRNDLVLTPCTESLAFDDLAPCRLFIKLENLHRTGSFKERGALNKLLQLTAEEKQRGVVTASAGNHGRGLAFHADRLGIPATVVMPVTTPLIKSSRTEAYGARVVLHGAGYDEAWEKARRLGEEEGTAVVHAFDDEAVIAGQGTIALELQEQLDEIDTVLVPIGGGGLISGISLGLKDRNPSIRVVGVEATAAPKARASLLEDEVVRIDGSDSIADGIAVKQLGEHTFPVIRELVDEVVTVSEDEIATAILLLLEREKTVAEGAGAVPLAALIGSQVEVDPDETVVLVLSGGNIDVNMISRIIDRGLVADGRLARLMVKVPDRPGSLQTLSRITGDLGANVLEIHHRRAFADISMGDAEVVMHLETRGQDHVMAVIRALEAEGLHVEEDL
ncbi:MAG: threonine ammonia-lyase [Longimicrobiales bacterium]